MSDRKAIHEVECPCCHGSGFLDVIDGDQVVKHRCQHCDGAGTVLIEEAAS